jgi:hypothetical protein
LWYVTEGALDRVIALWLPIGGADPLPTAWQRGLLSDWDANGVYAAEADPADPHAMYIGGEGRLGYLRPAGTGVQVDLPWIVPSDGSEIYVYVNAIWPDSERDARILFGGGEQGGGPASLLESLDRGRQPVQIAIEGAPSGSVRSIASAPDPALLLVAVNHADRSLGVYVLGR